TVAGPRPQRRLPTRGGARGRLEDALPGGRTAIPARVRGAVRRGETRAGAGSAGYGEDGHGAAARALRARQDDRVRGPDGPCRPVSPRAAPSAAGAASRRAAARGARRRLSG